MGNNYGLPLRRDEEALSRDEETNSKENQLSELQKKLSFMKKDRLKNKKYKFFSKEDADGNAIPFIRFKSDEEMSMNDVKRMFEENNSGPEPVPRALTAKKVNEYLEKANPTKREFINYFSSVELNKGGIPMKRQMDMFKDGGLEDEGGQVDPVSGNEVPIGGTKKGVRDDVPAMVSEGEFIFPEDVTRYIGLDKLMQLRQEAKMGLKRMEKMGQMGNGDEATMPDDMPFNMSDLMGAEAIVIEGRKKDDDEAAAIVAMAQGGVIYAQAGTSVPTTRSLAPVEQKPDYGPVSFNEVMGDGLQQTKVYINEDGVTKNIMFIGDKPLYPIPEGYTLFDPNAETTEDETVETTETEEAIPTRRRSSDRTPMKKTPFQEAGGWDMDFKDANGVVDPAKVKLWTDEAAKTTGSIPAVLTGVASVVAGPLGILVHLANKSNAKARDEHFDRAMAAAKQTSVPGQVAALNNITKAIKEGGDKSLLGTIVDKIGDVFGLGKDEKEKVVATATNAGNSITPTGDKLAVVETAQQKTEREAREIREATEAANKLLIDKDIPPSIFKGLDASELGSSIGSLSESDMITVLEQGRRQQRQIGDGRKLPDPRGTAASVPTGLRPPSVIASDEAAAAAIAAEEAAKAAQTTGAANASIKERAAADAIRKANAAAAAKIVADTVDGGQTTSALPTASAGLSEEARLFDDIKNAGAEIGVSPDVQTTGGKSPSYKELLNTLNSIKSDGLSALETVDMYSPAVGNALKSIDLEALASPNAPFIFTESTGVSRDGRTNEQILADARALLPPTSNALIDAGTNRISENRKSDGISGQEALDAKIKADKARAARKARRDAEKLKQELKEKAEFNAKATKGSTNLALERAIARAREAVPTRTNEELINIAQQTVAGQAAGKGYVGGFGFKKGGLASRKKKKK